MTLKHRIANLEEFHVRRNGSANLAAILKAGRDKHWSAKTAPQHTRSELEHIANTAPKNSLAAAVARARLRVKSYIGGDVS